MKIIHWEAIAEEKMPSETGTVLRRFSHGDETTVARVTFVEEGASVAAHTHPNEQWTMVLSGALRFTVDGVPVTVTSGEIIHLPSGVSHGAQSLVANSVVLDFFTPSRSDWSLPTR